MGISRYPLYKYVRIDGTWRYCKAAYHDNNKIKPGIVFVNVKEGLLEKHPEGRYYMSHNGGWIDAGTDALEAQRKRKQLAGHREPARKDVVTATRLEALGHHDIFGASASQRYPPVLAHGPFQRVERVGRERTVFRNGRSAHFSSP